MSSSQTNGKKTGSGSNSMVSTPASTPVTNISNGQTATQTSPPPNNNAPKYGKSLILCTNCSLFSFLSFEACLNFLLPPSSDGRRGYTFLFLGTLVPNRIFVGGISANTTEGELLQLFSNYGTVKAAKIIQDRAGVSRGYGFITFESEEDAKRLQRESDNIVLRERKLNIAPAIKKQVFTFYICVFVRLL